jgi:hypothetical protein
MMGSRNFYSSLNEVKLNIEEINSLQVDLSKKIQASIKKNIQNIEDVYRKPELLTALNSIGDTEVNDIAVMKFTQDANKISLTSRVDENIKNYYSSNQFKSTTITINSIFKAHYLICKIINYFNKIYNKIDNKIILFILICAVFGILYMFTFML